MTNRTSSKVGGYLFVSTAITKFHKVGCLNSINILSCISGDQGIDRAGSFEGC